MTDKEGIKLALIEAQKAFDLKEVPVGAVITKGNEVISRAFNQKESTHQPTGHAEILAIQQAAQKLSNWRLSGCTLYVSLEPCLMCGGAILQSRISRVVIGALDLKAGAVFSLYQILSDQRLNHRPEVVGHVLESECSSILKKFFQDALRSSHSK